MVTVIFPAFPNRWAGVLSIALTAISAPGLMVTEARGEALLPKVMEPAVPPPVVWANTPLRLVAPVLSVKFPSKSKSLELVVEDRIIFPASPWLEDVLIKLL